MADIWYIDYSAASLAGSTVLSTPVGPSGERATGAIRYIDDITNPSLVRTKHITKAEYEDFKRTGVRVDAMYMEVTEDDPLGGYERGQAYARRALAGANYLGYSGPILFCCDRWFVTKNRTTITPKVWQDYLSGARSVLGDRTGGYGFSDAADAAKGIVKHFVQCGARSLLRTDWVNGWQDNNYKPVVGGIQADRVLIIRSFTPTGGSVSAAEDVLNPNIIPNHVYPGVLDSASTLIGWTNKEAHDANIKATAAVNALNQLGAQLSVVFTTIDAKLNLILQNTTPEIQAQAERLSVDAEPLHQLCAPAHEIVAADEAEKAAKVDAQTATEPEGAGK